MTYSLYSFQKKILRISKTHTKCHSTDNRISCQLPLILLSLVSESKQTSWPFQHYHCVMDCTSNWWFISASECPASVHVMRVLLKWGSGFGWADVWFPGQDIKKSPSPSTTLTEIIMWAALIEGIINPDFLKLSMKQCSIAMLKSDGAVHDYKGMSDGSVDTHTYFFAPFNDDWSGIDDC